MKNWENKTFRLSKSELEIRQSVNLDSSEAHSPAHMERVAKITGLVGKIYDFAERESKLSYFAGQFHDKVRSSTEDPAVRDEEASAKEAYRMLLEDGFVTEEEGKAVAYAIERQGCYPEWWNDSKTRDRLPETLEEKIHLALFVADKIEANGAWIIARRSQFVAGDRLYEKGGDWQSFGLQPDKDESLAVVIESIIRLSFINPEGVYPQRLKQLVGPLYRTQREFVRGVFRGLDLKMEGIARLLLETKTNKGENILQARRISAPDNASELIALIVSKSGITDEEISSTPRDWVDSASETVDYFSHRYREDLDRLVVDWNPAGERAREWRQGMIDYMNQNNVEGGP